MSFKALVYAYVIGGITFIPLVIIGLVFFTIYTSLPLEDADANKEVKTNRNVQDQGQNQDPEKEKSLGGMGEPIALAVDDIPKTRKGWLTMRRKFEESAFDGSYVTLVRSFLDARSKDPKRSRPKDMWYVVLKGKVLYLYEDEGMTECEAAVELGGHDVVIYPEGLLDGELFARRNAICLKPKSSGSDKPLPSVTREMNLEEDVDIDKKVEEPGGNAKKHPKEREKLVEETKRREAVREEALNPSTPWFIFVRSNIEMEDWYLALVHASDHPSNSPTLSPLSGIFQPSDMNHLVSTLDAQPDVIPMRWLNALIGRIFFSYYRTHALEAYIIGRLMKKLSKVKRPAFLTDIVVTQVSVGNTAPTFSKPMLKELTREGDAALEVQLQYKGEIRITIEATATINLGARFKSYTVKLTLAAVLRELEGNLLIRVKRPPSNRIWYAFTQSPRIVLDVEPIVSDRQITWSMILNTIESRVKEIIQESVVMPNMDDIAFFESAPYQHRGGIWPDASRREKAPPSTLDSEPIVDESQSTASVPVTGTAPTAEAASSSLKKCQSAEQLSAGSSLSPPESVPVSRSSTTASDDSMRAKRRTWFSTIGSDDSVLEDQSTTGETIEVPRVRTPDPDTSQHHEVNSVQADSSDNDDSQAQTNYLAPSTTARRPSTSSRHSQSSFVPEHSPSSSFDNDFASPDPTLSPTSTPSKSPQSSHSRTSPNPPTSPTGFLSTLKSRAGDKQALSNSAKETMRKWGVNWGGLRRDGNGSGRSSNDDRPDHRNVDAATRTDNSVSGSQKTRPSYAEVRAAVTERKEREKSQEDSRSTSPVPIPDPVKGKGKAGSHSATTREMSSRSFSGGVSTSPPSSSILRPELSETGDASPKYVSPSISRTTTELHTPVHSSEGLELVVPTAIEPASPIHTQPSQARTMTIPGIHASHRGDVMSMGYVPPPQLAPTTSESKKGPAIQSVYRLWKSPVLSGQPQQSSQKQEINPRSQTSLEDESEEMNKDVAPLSLSSDTLSPPRPSPPPLPPRSTSTIISVTSTVSNTPQGSPSQSASESLKSMATKDDKARASLERTLPPSPPRRASTQGISDKGVRADESWSNVMVNGDSDTDQLFGAPEIPTTKQHLTTGPPLPARKIETSA